jgi:hypothetical protein
MAGSQRLDLGPEVGLDAGVVEQLQLGGRGLGSPPALRTAAMTSGLSRSKAGVGGRLGQGGGVDLFQPDNAAGSDQPQVGGHLLGSAAEREDQGPGIHQVERDRLELTGEQVVVDQRHVARIRSRPPPPASPPHTPTRPTRR